MIGLALRSFWRGIPPVVEQVFAAGGGAGFGAAAQQAPELSAVALQQVAQAQQVHGVDPQRARRQVVPGGQVFGRREKGVGGGAQLFAQRQLAQHPSQVAVQGGGGRVEQPAAGQGGELRVEIGRLQRIQQTGRKRGVQKIVRQVQAEEQAFFGAPLAAAGLHGGPVQASAVALEQRQQVVQVAQAEAEVVRLEVQRQVQQQVFGAEHQGGLTSQLGGLGALPDAARFGGGGAAGRRERPVQLDGVSAGFDQGRQMVVALGFVFGVDPALRLVAQGSKRLVGCLQRGARDQQVHIADRAKLQSFVHQLGQVQPFEHDGLNAGLLQGLQDLAHLVGEQHIAAGHVQAGFVQLAAHSRGCGDVFLFELPFQQRGDLVAAGLLE